MKTIYILINVILISANWFFIVPMVVNDSGQMLATAMGMVISVLIVCCLERIFKNFI